MPEDKRLPKVVALLDAFSGDQIATTARRESSFLPTDLFGPLISALPLQQLVEECRDAGLHFWGTYDERAPFREAVANETYLTLMPRSRLEVAQIVDAIRPNQFHRLLLGKRAAPAPPWNEPDGLAGWRPVLARHLRTLRLPKRRGPWRATRTFKVRSRPTNMLLELRTNDWVLEVLRQSQGKKSLGSILAESGGSIRNATLLQHLYLLHHLYLLNFEPPNR